MTNPLEHLASAMTIRPISGGANGAPQMFSWRTVAIAAFDSALVGGLAGLSSLAGFQELTPKALYAGGIAFGVAFFAKMAAFRGLQR